MSTPLKFLMPVSVLLLAASCNAASFSNVAATALPDVPPPEAMRRGASPIQHVIFILQENRSFNNLFMGYPGATTQNYGYDAYGNKIVLHAQDLATTWDIDHSSRAFFSACDGQGSVPGTTCKMDGWNNEFAGLGHPANFAYAYTPTSEIKPYWAIAKQYVLADQMFASNLDASFIAHQYEVAAYASTAVDFPYTSWGCAGGSTDTIATFKANRTYGPRIVACFDNPTIGSEADAAGVNWRFYAGAINADGGLWSSYQADRKVYHGRDWRTNVINPPSKFLTDIRSGKLANITWIAPTYQTSDHPGLNSSTGPAWVASLVNAVGTSSFWKSSAIFVIWDDWGGWFDPVQPVYEDYDGLGFRVPMLIVSPYARKGYVTHVQYETSSVLRFMEDTFGLQPLAASDSRANDPSTDALDYNESPRKFKKIAGAKATSYWILQGRMPRTSGTAKMFIDDD